MPKDKGLLLIISGPSGAGKTTIARELEKRLQAVFSVSVTTRPRAAKDLPGVDYHFVDRPTFQRMVAAGEFLEHAEVFGNLYGTPRKPVQQALERGQIMILEIDVQGGVAVKRQLPQALGIFILPPDDATLRTRLRGRGRDTDDVIARRLAQAHAEIAAARASGAYEFYIVNDNLQAAVKQALTAVHDRLARPEARGPAPGARL